MPTFIRFKDSKIFNIDNITSIGYSPENAKFPYTVSWDRGNDWAITRDEYELLVAKVGINVNL